MEFIRIDPRLDEHPDIVEVGFVGATVFQVVLRACASFDKRGRLPSKFSAAWLARRLGLTDEDTSLPPETFVQLGIDRCVKAGLLTQEGGELVIPGWERFYTAAASGAARTTAYRERQRRRPETDAAVTAVTNCDAPSSQASQPVTGVTRVTEARHCDATPHHFTSLHVTSQKEEAPGELRDGLEAGFKTQRGCAYRWTSADENELRQVALEPTAEVLRRWGIALSWAGYPRCDTVRDLVRHWNTYAKAPGRPQDVRKGVARADEQDWTGDGGYGALNAPGGAP